MASEPIQNLSRHGKLRSAGRSACIDQEHPGAIVRDIRSRSRPNGHVIVFANEKGGVGKSTLAFHCCVALANSGKRVAAIDLDRRQQTLNSALTSREGTAHFLEVELPCPKHVALAKQGGPHLMQEIERIGSDCDFIVIDAMGHDCPIARFAVALADTLVTPVNCSLIDLAVLGRFDPVTMGLKEPGPFAQLVETLRRERAELAQPALNWIVLKNRRRGLERTQQARIDDALQTLSSALDFRLGQGLNERVAYRDLFLFGLTQLDKQFLPFSTRNEKDINREVDGLIASLCLPIKPSREISRKCNFKAAATKKVVRDFIASLSLQAGNPART